MCVSKQEAIHSNIRRRLNNATIKKNKLYVVRVFNDKSSPDRHYEEYFFNKEGQEWFYSRITEQGFEAVKREEDGY